MKRREIYLDVDGLLTVRPFYEAGDTLKSSIKAKLGEIKPSKDTNVIFIESHHDLLTLTYNDERPAVIIHRSPVRILARAQYYISDDSEIFYIPAQKPIRHFKTKVAGLIVGLIALIAFAFYELPVRGDWGETRNMPLISTMPQDQLKPIIHRAAQKDLEVLLADDYDQSTALLVTGANIDKDYDDSVRYLVYLLYLHFTPNKNLIPLLKRIVQHRDLSDKTKNRARKLIDRIKRATSKNH